MDLNCCNQHVLYLFYVTSCELRTFAKNIESFLLYIGQGFLSMDYTS